MSAPSRTYLTATDVAVQLPDGRPLLANVTFGLGDHTVGLIGANGAGKSTLLAILAGERTPSHGHVQRAQARIGVVRQGLRAMPNATVASTLGVDRVLAAIARAERGAATVDDIAAIGDAWDLPERTRIALGDLDLAHLGLTRPMASVSGGEATRIALAAQWLAQPDVLLLDEPTNDLDARSRDAVHGLVARWRRGLLVATHDRALLAHVDRIVAIEHRTLVAYGGNWDVYVAERERQRLAAERERESAAAQLQRAKRDAQVVRERQTHRAAAGRASRDKGGIPKILLNARAGQSEATTARVSRTAARVVESAEARLQSASALASAHDRLRIPIASTRLASRSVIVSLREVTVAVGPDTPLLSQVTFDVVGPERVAMRGPNGVGKSSLLRLLARRTPPRAGEIYWGLAEHRVAYLDQRVALLDAGRTVQDAFAAHHSAWDVNMVRAALARFGFRADAALQSVESLSGGERMRAALACVLAGELPPSCLLLDEPTNHLDLESVQDVERALRTYDGAIIVVSHDAEFLSAIGVTRVEDITRWRVDRSDPIAVVDLS